MNLNCERDEGLFIDVILFFHRLELPKGPKFVSEQLFIKITEEIRWPCD